MPARNLASRNALARVKGRDQGRRRSRARHRGHGDHHLDRPMATDDGVFTAPVRSAIRACTSRDRRRGPVGGGPTSRSTVDPRRADPTSPRRAKGGGSLSSGLSKYADRESISLTRDGRRQGPRRVPDSEAGPCGLLSRGVRLLGTSRDGRRSDRPAGVPEPGAVEDDLVLFFLAGPGAPNPNNLRTSIYWPRHEPEEHSPGRACSLRMSRGSRRGSGERVMIPDRTNVNSEGMAVIRDTRTFDQPQPQIFLDKMLH